jgi:Transposase DDE domain
MVERFKPFLRHLLSLSLSRKTLHMHRDNLRISDVPDAKAQKNFTDPESRIMKSKDGFVQAYNAQIAVDAQIIVAQYVTQNGNDNGQLVPLIDAVEANLGRKPREVSADNGYCSESNLAALEVRDIDGYVATGRARDAAADKAKAKAGECSRAGRNTSTR